MRVTVVPVDRLIIRDDIVVNLPEWPFEDDHIHAIQFLDGSGEVELKGPPPVNEPFEGLDILQPYLDYLDAWIAAQQSPASTPESGTGEPIRARDESGQFIGDDPSTPDVNEAWAEVPADAT